MEWLTLRGVALWGLAYVNVYIETPCDLQSQSKVHFFFFFFAHLNSEMYILLTVSREKLYPTILKNMHVKK